MNVDDVKTGAEFLCKVREEGGLATDGIFPQWVRSGWAVHPFGSDIAHYWRRPPRGTGTEFPSRSFCGLVRAFESKRVALLSPGNFPRCKLCAKYVL